jgi:tetratricopeptide (TPR) repeat protein
MNIRPILLIVFACFATSAFVADAGAQDAAAKKKASDLKNIKLGMSILPERRNQVECEYPADRNGQIAAGVLEKLRIRSSRERFNHNGHIITDPTGRIVRVFLDKNRQGEKGFGTLDEWIYFKDGVEVYREIDRDFNERPDEYRWSGAGGSRWGLDKDQDGDIDEWRVISAEEVALEVFQAIKTKDAKRYYRLLLTDAELSSLKLNGDVLKDATARLKRAKEGFVPLVRAQKTISGSSKWIHSGNGMPSIAIPDQKNLGKDLFCYDHATSVYQTGDKVATLALGTVVRVGNVWRLMELPQFVEGSKPIENGGVFFPIPQMEMIEQGTGPDGIQEQSEEMIKLYASLAESDKEVEKAAAGAAMAQAQQKRAQIMINIYKKVKDKTERDNWLQNIADTVSDAYRKDEFPDGLRYLRSLGSQLKRSNIETGVDYIEWAAIFAEYGKALGGDSKTREKARTNYLIQIEKFAEAFPKSDRAPNALWELGQSSEVDGDEEIAVGWYEKLAKSYPNSPDGVRALGALRRLKGIGKKIPFKGESISGQKFDIANPALRGKLLVVHFWETWCADEKINQKGDTAFDEIVKLNKKYDGKVVFVGCNIEGGENNEAATKVFKDFMAKNPKIQWTQLHAPGGMERSPLAIQAGLVSIPLILVFDENGVLVETDSAVGTLDRQIQRIRNKPKQKQN